jgi:riboflavin kinase/FMN adenylyltransferase
MKIYRNEIPTISNCIVAIGAFDGVHKGHQALILQAKQMATESNAKLVIFTFSSPPKVYFKRAFSLCSLNERLRRLKSIGVDAVIVAEFNHTYIKKVKDEFITELKKLNPLAIHIGSNFKFGSGRKGTIEDLRNHFTVKVSKIMKCEDDVPISSTRIRELILSNNTFRARYLLGWKCESEMFVNEIKNSMPG